ncbi:MAG: sulfatase [Opitutales bacterium]
MRRALTALLLCAAGAFGADPPNFVVVFIDDLGGGDFGCCGGKGARTPAIDRLAAEGRRFTQFYVNSPICSPSRCALLTGQYPQRWRITSYLNNRAANERRGLAQWLDPKAPSLARTLKAAGYATGQFGKWHLGGQRDVDDAPPITAYGYDESLTNFEGMGPKLLPLTLRPGEEKPGRIWADAERLGGPVKWTMRSEITTGFVEAAAAFIDRSVAGGRPFFVTIMPDDVHSPFWPPVTDFREGRRGLYHAVLESMDRQLERLFSKIRSDDRLRDRTVILLCSDNGPEPGAGSAGPLRGHKTQLYEGGVRSPLIVWAPGLMRGARGGADESSVLAAFDLAPSLARMAGTTHGGSDGEDAAAALLGSAPHVRSAPLFWRRPPDRKNWLPALPDPQPDLAVRDGRWKLLCEYDGTKPLLFDLESDPGETRDLAAARPEVAARLVESVLGWNRSMPSDAALPAGKADAKKKR